MVDQVSLKDSLLELNRRTFKAEDEPQTARDVLGVVLSEDFTIVRANGKLERKQEMINRIAATSPGNRRRIDHKEVRVFSDAAVVRTCLTLVDQTGKAGKSYWNSKVFVRRESDWQCVAWHVTEVGPDGTPCVSDQQSAAGAR